MQDETLTRGPLTFQQMENERNITMKKIWGKVHGEDETEKPEDNKHKPENDEVNDGQFVTDGNRIFYYAPINEEMVLKLNKTLLEKARAAMGGTCWMDEGPGKIWLHVNSMGGYMTDGLAALDHIEKIKIPVHTVVDGAVASAATFLTICGAKRYISKNAFMLIHQLRYMMWGKAAELKDQMENVDLWMQTIKRVYGEYTKIPQAKLDEILKHDLYFDAETCLKYGLVDEII